MPPIRRSSRRDGAAAIVAAAGVMVSASAASAATPAGGTSASLAPPARTVDRRTPLDERLASIDLPAVIAGYGDFAEHAYARGERLAKAMRDRVRAFLAAPDGASLDAARRSWIEAREAYGESEALRFCGGPIDRIETLVNTWPVDEAYIDGVVGAVDSGIVNDPARCPNLGAAILSALNQRGGEANVSVGWHAIEFLLWGQDLDPRGPGARPWQDYATAPNAARRREYLSLVCDLLVEHLGSLRAAWSAGAKNHRATLRDGDPREALRAMVIGLRLLSGAEMAAERLAVAFETRDQEEEHSCFSDTTHLDLVANQRGIMAIYHGETHGGAGPGLRAVAVAVDPETAAALDTQLDASLAALRAIPAPFDQAMLGDDDAPGRRAMAAAIAALEAQSDSFAFIGRRLGLAIPHTIGRMSVVGGAFGFHRRLPGLPGLRRMAAAGAVGVALWAVGVALCAAVPRGRGDPAATTTTAAPSFDASRAGGAATVDDATPEAFALFAPTLSAAERRLFAVGNSFFKRNWVAAPASVTGRDGLGPLFAARSCSSCHSHDGRGRPPIGDEGSSAGLILRLGVRGEDGRVAPHPAYGDQLQDRAIAGVAPEGTFTIAPRSIFVHLHEDEVVELVHPSYSIGDLADGAIGDATLIGPRVAPALIGLGLLEAVPESAIVARADPDDGNGDGISGRAARVHSRVGGDAALGRFGWKATQATIADQVAVAFANDIGITSALVPRDGVTDVQRGRVGSSSGSGELSPHAFDAVTFYSRTLAVPARRGAGAEQLRRGEVLFTTLGCTACHVPELVTGEGTDLEPYRRQTIRPYTDLLLHDLGPMLADGLPEGDASGREWRTPPLWGVGLLETVNGHERLLHDGRARGVAEAILWHGGEAQRARDGFAALPRADRAAVVAFVRSL